MSEICTCGAVLPPEARFCHKCGKPQVELQQIDEPAPVQGPPDPIPAAPPPGINFRNPVAVRIGLFAAAAGTALGLVQLPLMMFWTFVRLAAAGFLAVYLYQRRTGSALSSREGARMGWITGVFSFVFTTVLTTIALVSVAVTKDLGAFFQEQFRSQAIQGPALEEALRFLETPAGLGVIVFLSLCFGFLFFASLPILGGVVGAKVLERD